MVEERLIRKSTRHIPLLLNLTFLLKVKVQDRVRVGERCVKRRLTLFWSQMNVMKAEKNSIKRWNSWPTRNRHFISSGKQKQLVPLYHYNSLQFP